MVINDHQGVGGDASLRKIALRPEPSRWRPGCRKPLSQILPAIARGFICSGSAAKSRLKVEALDQAGARERL
jgi:hypothetical protein